VKKVKSDQQNQRYCKKNTSSPGFIATRCTYVVCCCMRCSSRNRYVDM